MENKNALNDKELRKVNGGLVSRTEGRKYGVYDDCTGDLIAIYHSRKDAEKAANHYNISTREVSREQIKFLQEMFC